MPLLEDNPSKEDRLIIERFEKTLTKLLQAHTSHQKQIMHLTEENKTLKCLLEASKNNLNASPTKNHTSLPFDHPLVGQINKYIKEIDLCLAYFEQA